MRKPHQGEIPIGDRAANRVAAKDRCVAMVFQNYALYPHMDVYNNMAFGLKLRKTRKDKINQQVQEAAKLLGIEVSSRAGHVSCQADSASALPSDTRSCAIRRCPFSTNLSNLDAKLRVRMRTELEELVHTLQTTLYVTPWVYDRYRSQTSLPESQCPDSARGRVASATSLIHFRRSRKDDHTPN